MREITLQAAADGLIPARLRVERWPGRVAALSGPA